MSLKGTEKFVAESLQSHFKKSFDDVSINEGDDPPDIYLNIDNKKISVEITDIDQNVLKNRKTIDYGYLNFIDNICLLYTSPSPRDGLKSRMPSSA